MNDALFDLTPADYVPFPPTGLSLVSRARRCGSSRKSTDRGPAAVGAAAGLLQS